MSGILVGLLCAASWAIGSVMMRDLSRKLDPFTLNAPRTLVGGLSLLAVTYFTGRNAGFAAITLPQLGLMLGSMMVGGGIGDSLYVVAFKRIGVSRAFPISNAYPAIAVLLGIVFLTEDLTLRLIGGLLLVVVGVILISYEPRGRGQLDHGSAGGIAIALSAALMWAIAMTMLAPGIRGHDPIMVAAIRVLALTVALWLIVFARGTASDLKRLDRRDWVMVVIGGLIGWGAGSVLFVETVSLLGSSRAAIITSTSPLFALPLSVLFLKERPGRLVPIGTALAVAGIALIS